MGNTERLYDYFQRSTGVTTDTRLIAPGSIFFALKGENYDGNCFAGEALQKGAMLAVIDDPAREISGKTLLVENTLQSLQELAKYHRSKLNIDVIGLTGTNGKTTTKELIKSVLSQKYKVAATKGNLNNHIGVPLTILDIKQDDELAVVEMGANHIGEIAGLCTIAHPTHGLITNIGKAHLEGFGSYEGVIEAKTELYQYLANQHGKAFVNADDELLMKKSKELIRTTYGSGNTNNPDVTAQMMESVPFVKLAWEGFDKIETHLYGSYNFQNILAALCCGVVFNVEASLIVEAITTYRPTNNRSQLLKTEWNTIYLDAYNANPSSMLLSIQNFEEQDGDRKMLILGDMLELGKVSKEEHKNILDEVADKFDLVILVGPEFKSVSEGKYLSFDNIEDTASWLKDNPVRDMLVLVKGSRGIAVEKLTSYL